MTAPILVCGATGQVGAALGRALDARGLAWVGLSRRAQPPGAKAASRQGDFSVPASLAPALQGITTVFLACGDDPHQDQLEIDMISACRSQGVRHIVKLSAQSAGLLPPVSFGRMHARSEQALRESGLAWTVLRPVFFMQSLLFFAASIRGGKIVAATGAGRVAWVDVRDVADAAAAVLADLQRHAAGTYTLTGAQACSFADAAGLLSQAASRRVVHISPPVWLARLVLPLVSGMPRWQSNLAVELMAAIGQGAQESVSADLTTLLQRAPRMLAAFIDQNRAAFAAAPAPARATR